MSSDDIDMMSGQVKGRIGQHLILMVIITISILICSCARSRDIETNNDSTYKGIELTDGLISIHSVELSDYLECFADADFISRPDGENESYVASIWMTNRIIHDCILKKSFVGEKPAITFLCKYLKVIGASNFDFNTKYFRGEELANVLIDISYFDECTEGQHGVSISTNSLMALFNSIKTIRGLDINEYSQKRVVPDPPNSNACIEGYEVIYILDDLKAAINDRQVVFKSYGEF